MSRPTRPSLAAVFLLTLGAIACDGPQSTLTPAGRDAEQIATIFFWMAGGAAVIWLAVVGLAAYALRRPRGHSDRQAKLLVIGGGVVFTTVVLTALTAYGLSAMPRLLAPGPPGALEVEIVGEQWWWRVHYRAPDGTMIPAANELRLPVGERSNLRLASADVIHSFWVPSLAGKMDMIPGRRTLLAVEPTRTGIFRGACAEFCGASHGLMNFDAVVMSRPEFDAWLAQQAAPARVPSGALERAGLAVFTRTGCGACHTIRGTSADGRLGPDLTHVGSRTTVGAGLLSNDSAALARWIATVDRLKPGAHMPAFGMLPPGDVRALAAYLSSLQ